MHRKEGICSGYWLDKVDMICFTIAMPSHQMCIYDLDQPAFGKKRKKRPTSKNIGSGKQLPTSRQARETTSPYLLQKFQDSTDLVIIFFQSLPPNAPRSINSQIHYSREKCQGKDYDYYFRSSSTVLLGKTCDGCPLWHHKSLVVVVGFLHMYTLNSCHFFLYLWWIFRKCYQSTCFTVFLLSFSFSFFSPFTVGLREAAMHILKLIRRERNNVRPCAGSLRDSGCLYVE